MPRLSTSQPFPVAGDDVSYPAHNDTWMDLDSRQFLPSSEIDPSDQKTNLFDEDSEDKYHPVSGLISPPSGIEDANPSPYQTDKFSFIDPVTTVASIPQPYHSLGTGYKTYMYTPDASKRPCHEQKDDDRDAKVEPRMERFKKSRSPGWPLPQKQREKNRLAAQKCRRRQKDGIEKLCQQEHDLGREHRSLEAIVRSPKDEVLSLKNQILAHGVTCDCELIRSYIAKQATKGF